MTKKVRGPVRSHRRPGTRPPSDRPANKRRPADAEAGAATRQSQLAAAPEVAEAVVEQPPAAAAEEVRRATPAAHSKHRIKAGSLLAARAATEYVYVAQDMRRIIAVTAALVTVMLVLWLLIVILRVVELPFY
ncbi:hypothetical protein BH24CHL5_BH24CHL5_13030 [soil metagenome]